MKEKNDGAIRPNTCSKRILTSLMSQLSHAFYRVCKYHDDITEISIFPAHFHRYL